MNDLLKSGVPEMRSNRKLLCLVYDGGLFVYVIENVF